MLAASEFSVNSTNTMILYKYLSPHRLDVLENHMIRFTQYGDFNDPFELNPNIDKLAEEKEIRKLVEKDFVKIIEEEYEKNPLIQTFISKENFIQLAKGREEAVKNLVVCMEPKVVQMLPGMLQETTNSLMGALSLSEVYDHELMWSHYADEHRGFVLGFDSSHSFFNQKKIESDELRHLHKIKYSKFPPAINLMETSASEVFFIKSSKWEYENEWRMLLPLSDSSKCIVKKPYPIHLFKFPTQAINCVILGSRSSDVIQNQIKSLLKADEFSHIKLVSAYLDRSSYGINIKEEKS